MAGVWMIGLAVGWSVLIGGCTLPRRMVNTAHFVGVRYDVEPVFVGRSLQEARRKIKQDFRAAAELGFSHVVLYFVDEKEQDDLIAGAEEVGLSVILSAQRLNHFVRGSAGTNAGAKLDGLARSALPEARYGGHAVTVMLDSGPSRRTADRAKKVAAMLKQRDVAYTITGEVGSWGELGASGGFTPPAIVDAAVPDPASDRSPMEHWLASYHTALTQGRTGGFILDRWRTIPGDRPGLFVREARLPTAAETALHRVLIRARSWGPRLHGLPASPLSIGDKGMGQLSTTAFLAGKLRFVLVFNRSPDSYARGTVRLPRMIGKAPVRRMVEIPPSIRYGPGRVLRAGSEGIDVPIALRPGDAVLFEVF